MKSVLLVLLILCFAFFVSAIKFQGNISVTATADGWDFRKSSLKIKPFSVEYTSRAVEKAHGKDVHDFNISSIYGGAFFVSFAAPYVFLSSYAADSQFVRKNTSSGWDSADVSLALSYIATAYLRIEEKSPNGTVVSTTRLHRTTSINWESDYVSSGSELSSASFVGTPVNGAGWTINITFIASSVVGVIDLANAVVGPSSLEQVVQINNYNYQSPDNYISLVMQVASDSVTATASSASTVLSSGSSSSKIYFATCGTALVDGKTKNVNVNVTASASVDEDGRDNVEMLLQLTKKFGTSISYTYVSVDFPAGSEAIAYDPSQGAGTQLPATGSPSTSPASFVSCSFFFIAFALFALLL